MTVTSPNVTFRTLMLILLVATVLVGATPDAYSQTRPQTKEERTAIAIIEGWAAAFGARDPDKIGSYLAENGEFDDDPRAAEERTQSADR
jgi:hypothetical protein